MSEEFARLLSASPHPDLAAARFDEWIARLDSEAEWPPDSKSVIAMGMILGRIDDLGRVAASMPELATLMTQPGFVATPTAEVLRERVRRALGASATASEAASRVNALAALESIRAEFAFLVGAWSATALVRIRAHVARAADEGEQQILENWEEARQSPPVMGYPHGADLHDLEVARRRVRELSAQIVPNMVVGRSDRDRIADALGANSEAGIRLVDALPNPSQCFQALCESEDSLHRLTQIVDSAPALVEDLLARPDLVEDALAGDPGLAKRTWASPALDTSPAVLARSFRGALLSTLLRWVIEPNFELGVEISKLHDALVQHVCGRLCSGFDLVGLGPFGREEVVYGSDLDVLLLVRDGRAGAEEQLAMVMFFLAGLERHGAPITLNGGDSGVVLPPGRVPRVRTYEEFRQYELEAMGIEERFGLGFARQIVGDGQAGRLILKAAYAQPLTPERLRELVTAKRRIESQRVAVQHRRRNVAWGIGSIADIEWLVHLHEMRFPTATHAGSEINLDGRIANLANARLLNSVERDELIEARKHLSEVSQRLVLLGISRDVIPENPAKLARLASVFGYVDGNDFLAYHERVIETVRAIYLEALERLKA